MKKSASIALALALVVFISTSARAQLFYDFSFTSGGMDATGSFSVVNGVAVGGTITVTGVPIEATPNTTVTATGSLVPNLNSPGSMDIRNHDGDVITFDNAVNIAGDPILNSNGLGFASGQYDASHYNTIINLWGNSPGSYSLFIGEADVDANGNLIEEDPQWVYVTKNGTLVVVNATAAPEPTTCVLMLGGLIALLWAMRRRLRVE